MARGQRGSVTRYRGKRGVVFRVKYRDANGRQVMETVGAEADGWTERRAEEELQARLVDVRREGLTKPVAETFETFARAWLDTYPEAKGLKKSTTDGYRTIIEKHLLPAFGSLRVGSIDVARVDAYVAKARRKGFAPRTINRHLNLLHALFQAALRRKLVRTNPVSFVDRPREPRRSWTILAPDEIARAEQAFRELAEAAKGEERSWREQARVVFLTVIATGLRRGEVLGLRWEDLALADPDGPCLRVNRTVVRGQDDTPKSQASERTIPLGPRIAEELFEHRRRSALNRDEERVFCHPQKGSVLDHKRYAKTLRLALGKAKITRSVRPFHDFRHTAITNDAASGNAPLAVMKRAGHSDFATTQQYIDLAGVTFRDEAVRAEDRVLGGIRY